jgi:hypothetical protein
MKKISLAINILLLGIIAFQACNSNTVAKPSPGNITDKPSANKFDCNDSCNRRFCKKYSISDLGGKLDVGVIAALSNAYKDDIGKAYINGIKKDSDALSVVFDVEKIKTLIYEMETKACLRGCDPSTELGIRYYYIKYPKLGSGFAPRGLTDFPEENSFKHSLVMVPVYKIAGGKDWYDYDLFGMSATTTCFPKMPKNSAGLPYMPFGLLPDAGDNHGGIGPPPEPGTFPTNN